MNKILIFGKNGFLGRSLENLFLSDGITPIAFSRKELDLLSKKSVEKIARKYDAVDTCVINCAIKSGFRENSPTYQDFYENILMQENIIQAFKYSKIFLFPTGQNKNASNFYNLSKYINEKVSAYHSLSAYNSPDRRSIVNLKIYNCFGALESSNRFISKCIYNAWRNKDINIFDNIKMDFFYIEDLYKTIRHHKEKRSLIRDIDCVYKEKKYLSTIANYICNKLRSSSKINVDKRTENHYIGEYNLFMENIESEFSGLYGGIDKIIEGNGLQQDKGLLTTNISQ